MAADCGRRLAACVAVPLCIVRCVTAALLTAGLEGDGCDGGRCDVSLVDDGAVDGLLLPGFFTELNLLLLLLPEDAFIRPPLLYIFTRHFSENTVLGQSDLFHCSFSIADA